MGIAIAVWLDFNSYVSEKETVLSSWLWRVFFLLLATTFGLTIGYSRIFLGVHSWD